MDTINCYDNIYWINNDIRIVNLGVSSQYTLLWIQEWLVRLSIWAKSFLAFVNTRVDSNSAYNLSNSFTTIGILITKVTRISKAFWYSLNRNQKMDNNDNNLISIYGSL